MIKSIKVRLKPTKQQENKIEESANVSRWGYNWALGKQIEYFEKTGKLTKIPDGILRKELTQLKKQEEFKWLFKVSAQIPKQAIKDCCKAIDRFHSESKKYGYKYRKSAIKSGKKLTFRDFKYFPRFKKKFKVEPSFYNDNAKLKVKKETILLEKIGWVKYSEPNRISINTDYTNPRITNDGKYWYLSVGIKTEVKNIELSEISIGIDLGIKDLAIVNNIEKPFKNINKTKKVKRLKKQLKRKERKLSKKYKNNKKGESYTATKNIIKLKKEVKLINRKISNIRLNHIHQTTNSIVKTKPCRIVVEDLNVSGMMKNKHLSKAIQEQCFNKFINIMNYKCNYYNIEFVKANRFYPSSKTCSCCGNIKKDLKLKDRIYICQECGLTMDRDKNASINLSRYQKSA